MMGNTKSKNDTLKAEESATNSKADPKEAKEALKKWLRDNRYHEEWWDKLKGTKEGRSVNWDLRKEFCDKRDGKAILGIYKQSKDLQIEENKTKIKSLEEKLQQCDRTKQLEAIKSSPMIIAYDVPTAIIDVLIEFMGSNVLPIAYSLSYLPFFTPVRGMEVEEYDESMHRWWEEVRVSPDHKGWFTPTQLQNAAKEFDQYFIERLAENGDGLKYHHSMIPYFAIAPKYNVFDRAKWIGVKLPTKHSACVGGIELFQRLYLEAIEEGGHESFDVDLVRIQESHGDNWCFDGHGLVLMADGGYRAVSELKVGDEVRSFPNAISKVECVIVSNINDHIEMVQLSNDCWITFEHPVLVKNGQNGEYFGNEWNMDMYSGLDRLDSDEVAEYGLEWALPKELYPVQMRFQDKIYNFVLDSHHSINVNGNWCCTLGHDYKGKVIEHEFWGNSERMVSHLKASSNTYPFVVFDRR